MILKRLLQSLFIFILIVMTYGTVMASLDRSVITALKELWVDPWFKVTLYDTYFAFLVFYLWVAYKETKVFSKTLWLLLILILGNFAIAVYMLIQIAKADHKNLASSILLNQRKQ